MNEELYPQGEEVTAGAPQEPTPDPIIPPTPQNPYYYSAYQVPPAYRPPEPSYMPPLYRPAPAEAPREEKQPDKPKKNRLGLKITALALCCAILGAACGAMMSYFILDDDTPATVSETQKSPENLSATVATTPAPTRSDDLLTLSEVYQSNVPAIVGISNEATYNVFGQTSTTASTGTGFIISSDGEILTNYHVVEGADTLTVAMYDGSEYTATLIGYEAESDVALLKIDASGLPVCTLGDSDSLYVGEQIAAIGNPMGELTYTMTVGYVSATDRYINTDGTPINMMQVDAAINPGNSGGPIFNMYGEVVGIATAKYSGTTDGGATIEGLGFAIPINDVVEILDDLRENGAVLDRAYMGIVVSTITEDLSETYGIDYGVLVQSVEYGGSAQKAGMQAFDVIIGIGDTKITAYEELQQTLRGYRAGDKTTITVFRNGNKLTLSITFDAKPVDIETEPEATEPTTEYNPWGEFPFGGGW